MAIQVMIFYILPVQVPERWRHYENNASLSIRFLALVHQYDARTNSFPSMHVSVAMLTALHLTDNLQGMFGPWSYLALIFPTLISLSTVFTKQHYLIDIPPGALLGYMNYYAYREYFS
ncbi:phosphatase PAP2 family protein [Azospirillum sp. INR13]|uniref:phosphatase PAP2 family protein n=1 Tax=Azospirillum sp. INR13 TaxID=2596919 RepID=UPI00351C5F6A